MCTYVCVYIYIRMCNKCKHLNLLDKFMETNQNKTTEKCREPIYHEILAIYKIL